MQKNIKNQKKLIKKRKLRRTSAKEMKIEYINVNLVSSLRKLVIK